MNEKPTLLKNVGPRQNAIAITLDGDALEPQRHRRALHHRSRTAASRLARW